MFNLTNKIALVTGASSGIGKGIATAFAQQGATVIMAARRMEKLQSIAQELSKEHNSIFPVQLDVLNSKQISQTIATISASHKTIDILVNNAGVYRETPIETASENDWDLVLDTNLKAYMMMTKAVVPLMKKQHTGCIINIGSVAMGGQGFGAAKGSAYTASKGAVVGLTESLANELAPMGIRVNCIAPGLIESEMTDAITSNPDALKGLLTRIPIGRAGKPSEIAAGAVFLASDDASYVTGSTLVIDGGWLSL